jgi:fatty-acid desaturase
MTTFVVAFLFFYIWYIAGITIGYHRLLSHRALRSNKLWEYFWVAGGYLAYQGSPIWWTAIHRAHHKHVDTELDPHSPRFGLLHSYVGWVPAYIMGYPEHVNPKTQCKDLYKDAVYRFLEQGGKPIRAAILNAFIVVSFDLLLTCVLGWQVGLASVLATLVAFQIPNALNTFCHIQHLGYRGFATADDSVNVWWFAIVALGEGWHNNHHAFPGSSRSGLRPYEFDFSWWLIKLGLATGMVTYANEPHGVTKRLNRNRPQAVINRFKRRQQTKQYNAL